MRRRLYNSEWDHFRFHHIIYRKIRLSDELFVRIQSTIIYKYLKQCLLSNNARLFFE